MKNSLYDNESLLKNNTLKVESNKLINKGSASVTVILPNGKEYKSANLKLNDINAPLITALLNDPLIFTYLKLPLSLNKHIILSKNIIVNTTFIINFNFKDTSEQLL